MAHIYKQKESRFWWISYRDTMGKIIRQSTKLTDYVRAKRLEAEYTFKESKICAPSPDENWRTWVPNFIDERYGDKKLRMECAWRNLDMFLDEHKLLAPRQIDREHANAYLVWRKNPNKSKGKYHAGRNTTIFEIKLMSIILDESVLRGHAAFNPWLKLKLRRDAVKQKPEFTRAAMAKILVEIRKLPNSPQKTFFLHSFRIGRYHGVRLSETHLNPMTAVSSGPVPTITFKIKGGEMHTVFLHPKLVRWFKRLQSARITETYTRRKSASKDWFNFLTQTGIKREFPNACFHSLRVTAATTFARNGVPAKTAMDYLGHASTTVHYSYIRLKAEDLSICAKALR